MFVVFQAAEMGNVQDLSDGLDISDDDDEDEDKEEEENGPPLAPPTPPTAPSPPSPPFPVSSSPDITPAPAAKAQGAPIRTFTSSTTRRSAKRQHESEHVHGTPTASDASDAADPPRQVTTHASKQTQNMSIVCVLTEGAVMIKMMRKTTRTARLVSGAVVAAASGSGKTEAKGEVRGNRAAKPVALPRAVAIGVAESREFGGGDDYRGGN